MKEKFSYEEKDNQSLSSSSSTNSSGSNSSVYGKLTESQTSVFFSPKKTKSSIRLMTSTDSPRSAKESLARKRRNSGGGSTNSGNSGNSGNSRKNNSKRVFTRRSLLGTFSSRAKTTNRMPNKKQSDYQGHIEGVRAVLEHNKSSPAVYVPKKKAVFRNIPKKKSRFERSRLKKQERLAREAKNAENYLKKHGI